MRGQFVIRGSSQVLPFLLVDLPQQIMQFSGVLLLYEVKHQGTRFVVVPEKKIRHRKIVGIVVCRGSDPVSLLKERARFRQLSSLYVEFPEIVVCIVGMRIEGERFSKLPSGQRGLSRMQK